MNHFSPQGAFASPGLFAVAFGKRPIRSFFSLFLVFFWTVFLISCPSPAGSSKEKTYTLTVTQPDQGSITITVDDEVKTSPVSISEGKEARLQYQNPVDAYYLDSWTGDADGEENPLTVTMDQDKTIGARLAGIQEQTVGDITYTLYRDTATIKSYNVDSAETSLTLEGSITVEETIYTITAIGTEAFKDAANLTNVVIPASVLILEDRAFSDSSLARIEFLGEKTVLGADVFKKVPLLGLSAPMLKIALGGGVTASPGVYEIISQGVYDGDFAYYLYKSGGGSYAVLGDYKGSDTALVIPGTTTNGNTTFIVISMVTNSLSNKGLTSVTFPESMVYIETSSLNDNALTSLTIPASVAFIEGGAFKANSSLISVEFKGSNTFLSQDIFLETPLHDLGLGGSLAEAKTYSVQP